MVPFHHPAISLRLARFDHLTLVAGVVELKTVLNRKEQCSTVDIKSYKVQVFSHTSTLDAFWALNIFFLFKIFMINSKYQGYV